MREDLLELLDLNGYTLIQKSEYVIVKKKVIRAVGELLIFGITGLMLIAFGSFFFSGIRELGMFALIVGLILIYIPFFGYISAPYRGLTINLSDRNLLFRSRISRAYKFSEIEGLEINEETSDSETSAFSKSNKEFRSRINLLFIGNVKEELFKIVSDTECRLQVEEIRDYMISIFRTGYGD